MFSGSGFRPLCLVVLDLGYWVWGLGFWVSPQGVGFRIWGLRLQGLEEPKALEGYLGWRWLSRTLKPKPLNPKSLNLKSVNPKSLNPEP